MKTLQDYPEEIQARNRNARLRTRGLQDTLRDRWKIDRVPNAYEDTACKAQARGHYLLAARMFYLGSCVSHGHQRAARYEQACQDCLTLHGRKVGALACPNDTDGDGNCHLCARRGGCPARGGTARVLVATGAAS